MAKGEDPPLIKAFLNEECYVIELGSRPPGERRDMIKWCDEKVGEEGVDWQLIALGDDFFMAIFINHDNGVLFELTWC